MSLLSCWSIQRMFKAGMDASRASRIRHRMMNT